MVSRLLLLSVVLVLGAGPARAERRIQPGYGSLYSLDHRVEIGASVGYAWTAGRNFTYTDVPGEIDLVNSPSLTFTIDVNVHDDAQLTLLYDRQKTQVEFRGDLSGVTQPLTDMVVEYWQFGAMPGMRRGNKYPFALLTIGGTRYVPQGVGFAVDEWKLSMMFGLGAKYYAGDRLGLRIQGYVPITFYRTGSAIGCGTGGCYTSIGGSGAIRIGVSAGVFFRI